MWIDGAVFTGNIADPEQSKVIDKVGIAPFPEGRAGSRPFLNNWVWCISPFSAKKEAAWYFIQWVTNKENNKRVALRGVAPARSSTWTDPDFHDTGVASKYPGYIPSFVENLKKASPWFNPPVIPVGEYRDIVGKVIVASILGEDVKKAAETAEKQLSNLLLANN